MSAPDHINLVEIASGLDTSARNVLVQSIVRCTLRGNFVPLDAETIHALRVEMENLNTEMEAVWEYLDEAEANLEGGAA